MGKGKALGFLALGELLAMGLWFSASAVVPQLEQEWALGAAGSAWLTMSVQLGFVVGALGSALLNLPDRVPLPGLIAASTLAAAAANAAIPLLDPGPAGAMVLRALTGAALAGAYPPGMKLVASWTKADRGFYIGFLVGALTVGSAGPHLLNALPILGEGGMPPWRTVLWASSALAAAGAAMVLLLVRPGPLLPASAPFNWRHATSAFRDRPLRLVNFGYLGHMWELYAMWTWAPLLLLDSYGAAGWGQSAARLAGFAVIGIGGAGCVLAGLVADRAGRTLTTVVSLVISGSCCLVVGLFFAQPAILTAVCLVWGFAVVADSAQFSTAVSELADSRYVGTALTMQTCLGFLLTLVTIQAVPPLVDALGWEWVFLFLAPGPVFGAVSMLRLRRLPEARRMASGHR